MNPIYMQNIMKRKRENRANARESTARNNDFPETQSLRGTKPITHCSRSHKKMQLKDKHLQRMNLSTSQSHSEFAHCQQFVILDPRLVDRVLVQCAILSCISADSFKATHVVMPVLLDEASLLQAFNCSVDGLRLRMLSTAASTQSSKSAWSTSPRMQRLVGIVSTEDTKECRRLILISQGERIKTGRPLRAR